MMSAIKRVMIVAFVVLAVMGVAGCFGLSDRDKAQDHYDRLVVETNGQLEVVQNVSNQQNLYAMSQPMMKEWLAEYRSQVVTLRDDVNATGEAGVRLKQHLSPGSSDYKTMTANEETLQHYLALYVDDYNKNARDYNIHWGPEFGVVPLI